MCILSKIKPQMSSTEILPRFLLQKRIDLWTSRACLHRESAAKIPLPIVWHLIVLSILTENIRTNSTWNIFSSHWILLCLFSRLISCWQKERMLFVLWCSKRLFFFLIITFVFKNIVNMIPQSTFLPSGSWFPVEITLAENIPKTLTKFWVYT